MTAPFDWDFPYAWPRKPILAEDVVCTSQPLAAQAGLRMLAEGGSAVDAAIATAIALTVVEQVSNGIAAKDRFVLTLLEPASASVRAAGTRSRPMLIGVAAGVLAAGAVAGGLFLQRRRR